MGKKMDDWKQSVKYKFSRTKQWCEENPYLAFCFFATAAGCVSYFARLAKPGIQRYIDNRSSRKNVYDPVNFMYVRTKRPLTIKQTIELDQRRRMGQSVIQALDEMRLLRR